MIPVVRLTVVAQLVTGMAHLGASANVAAEAPEVQMDLAACVGSRQITIEPTVRLVLAHAPPEALISGWCETVDNTEWDQWRWALGLLAELEITGDFRDRDYRLVLDLKQARPDQCMGVLINGEPLGSLFPDVEQSHQGIYELDIPARVLRKGRNRIVFQFSTTGPYGNDLRPMAVAFRKVEIVPRGLSLQLYSGRHSETVATDFGKAHLRWRAYIPPRAQLVIQAESDASSAGSVLSALSVEVEWGGRRHALISGTEEHARSSSSLTLDLSRFANSYVDLELIVDSGRLGSATQARLVRPAIVAPGGRPRPNVFVFTLDSLRSDHTACYGYERQTSPNMDWLAAGGVRFETAVSPSSWTLPSLMSVHSGKYPHELVDWMESARLELPDDIQTLAEIFAANGYRTLGVTSHDYSSSQFGLGRGFEVFDDIVGESRPFRPGFEVVERFRQHWADKADSRPVFVWLHIFEPHWGYDPPYQFFEELYGEEARRFHPDTVTHWVLKLDISRFWKHHPRRVAMPASLVEFFTAAYDANIRCADAYLGQAIEVIASNISLDDSVVCVTSDHGESLGEDLWHFTHSQSLRAELLRVPLIIRYPARLARGVVDLPVSITGAFPALLELAGISSTDVRHQFSAPNVLHPRREDVLLAHLVNQNKAHNLPPDEQVQFSIIRDGVQTIVYPNRCENPLEAYRITPGPWLPEWPGDVAQQLALIDALDRPRKTVSLGTRDQLVISELDAHEHEQHTDPDLPPDVLRRLQAIGYLGGEDED